MSMQAQSRNPTRDLEKVRVLLRAKSLPGDYIFQLLDYERQLKTGFLATEDRNFIDALYQWYQASNPQAQADENRTEAFGADATAKLKQTLKDTEEKLALVQARVVQLEREMSDLEDGYEQQIAILRRHLEHAGTDNVELETVQPVEIDRRFQEIRRRFARQFHPDQIDGSGPERDQRIAIFKSFWAEFARVEKS